MHFSLCDLIADLTQNSIEADASRVNVEIDESDTFLSVKIEDDGKGMNEQTLARVTDPFYTDGIKHPKRKIGMGIPFLIQTANDTGGSWNITSEPGKGTTVTAGFDITNIDTPPLGDVPMLFRQLLTFTGSFEMCITRKKNTSAKSIEYTLLRSELTEALGNLETAGNLALLGEFLQSQESTETTIGE